VTESGITSGNMAPQLRRASGAKIFHLPGPTAEHRSLSILHEAAVGGTMLQAKRVPDLVIDHLDETLLKDFPRLPIFRAKAPSGNRTGTCPPNSQSKDAESGISPFRRRDIATGQANDFEEAVWFSAKLLLQPIQEFLRPVAISRSIGPPRVTAPQAAPLPGSENAPPLRLWPWR